MRVWILFLVLMLGLSTGCSRKEKPVPGPDAQLSQAQALPELPQNKVNVISQPPPDYSFKEAPDDLQPPSADAEETPNLD